MATTFKLGRQAIVYEIKRLQCSDELPAMIVAAKTNSDLLVDFNRLIESRNDRFIRSSYVLYVTVNLSEVVSQSF